MTMDALLIKELELMELSPGKVKNTKNKCLVETANKRNKNYQSEILQFRELSVYPNIKELKQKTLSPVFENRIHGAYKSVDEYLDIHFKLIREDFIHSLRQGLHGFWNHLKYYTEPFESRYESVRFYHNTTFEKNSFSENSALCYTALFKPNSNFNWESSRHFMTGSLVLFSANDFRSFFCATVRGHDSDLMKGRLSVVIEDLDIEDEFIFDNSFIMIESDAFFEPCHVILQVLQRLDVLSFPMSTYIINACMEVQLPAYLAKFQCWDVFGFKTNSLDMNTWPTHEEIGLDQHQYGALKTALTSDFSVIQGPPGTGKTFLGLKIVSVLVKNMELSEFIIQNPILLVCYTNHALDQFLEGVLDITHNIIRVGGQSRSEKLKVYNLKEKKALRKGGRTGIEHDDRLRRQITKTWSKTLDMLKKLDLLDEDRLMLDKPRGIISFEFLEKFLTDQERELITSDYSLIMWLLDETEVDVTFHCNDDLSFILDSSVEPLDNFETEIFKDLFKSNNDDKNSEETEDEKDKERLTYCISLSGLARACTHFQDDLNSVEDVKSIEYTWAERKFKSHIQKYFILHDYLDNTMFNDKQYRSEKQAFSSLSLENRWNHYYRWCEKLKENLNKRIRKMKEAYRLEMKQLDAYHREEEVSILKTASVVGMTTTCAARFYSVMKMLKPSIVIVEEAAEVLEAHIVASLTKDTKQVILIGDHKQLKPTTSTDVLSKKYNMDVSLFERMINNGISRPVLRVQHRMRPEIASLVSPNFYDVLENHASVYNYESIKGVTKSVFFLEHSICEEEVENSTSFTNTHEADFVLELCFYFRNQGYSSNSITILTTYGAQQLHLKSQKSNLFSERLNGTRICVVDEYQGEENDIIILSLVRSNKRKVIGFLKTHNRICVAFSRAKKGFFIIGNMDMLSECSEMWQNIRQTLIHMDAIGPMLVLRCEKHGTTTRVASAEDFVSVRSGGCSVKCGDTLECGHECIYPCHVIDLNHTEDFICQFMCDRILNCGHEVSLPCSTDVSTYPCEAWVDFKSPICGHSKMKLCSDVDTERICDASCGKKLSCGHVCLEICHSPEDHNKVQCRELCSKQPLQCKSNHKCKKLCYEDCGLCCELEEYSFPCGHSAAIECSSDRAKVKCPIKCGKECPVCYKPCEKRCSEPCHPCMNLVTKKVRGDCNHYIEVPCSVIPAPNLCKTPCVIFENAACGHDAIYDIPCHRKISGFKVEDYLENCEEPCDKILECGHACTGTCGRCLQGRLHQGCKKLCKKELICGHRCSYSCQEVCPSCIKPCMIQCEHLIERNVQKKCGVSNILCQKKCALRCEHTRCSMTCGELCNREPCMQACRKRLPCSHRCVGFCGEPCPPVCAICHEDNVDGNYKYILLVDCKCVVESIAFEEYLLEYANKIEVYRCPACKTPIVKTKRLMNKIKQRYRHIFDVNKIVTGKGLDQQFTKMRCSVIDKLRENYPFKEKGLFAAHDLKIDFLKAVFNKNDVIKKQDLAVINYFMSTFNMIGKLLMSTSDEIVKSIPGQKAVTMFNTILEKIKAEELMKNLQLMNGLRCEIMRFYEAMNYSILLNETFSKKLKSKEVKSLCGEIEKLVFSYSRYTPTSDREFSKLFESFLKIVPSDRKWLFGPHLVASVKRMDFLGPVGISNWYLCPKKHYFTSEKESPSCPECHP